MVTFTPGAVTNPDSLSAATLMMGEYATSDEAPGRLIWWDLDERTGRLAVFAVKRNSV
jgi:hypothetical protein